MAVRRDGATVQDYVAHSWTTAVPVAEVQTVVTGVG
jgi:hypothetical protein